jgi:DNA-binding transcriptional MerR regulator
MTFSTPQLRETTGVSSRQITYWTDQHLLSPAGVLGGNSYEWDETTLVRIVVIKSLLGLGIRGPVLRSCLRPLRPKKVLDAVRLHPTVFVLFRQDGGPPWIFTDLRRLIQKVSSMRTGAAIVHFGAPFRIALLPGGMKQPGYLLRRIA